MVVKSKQSSSDVAFADKVVAVCLSLEIVGLLLYLRGEEQLAALGLGDVPEKDFVGQDAMAPPAAFAVLVLLLAVAFLALRRRRLERVGPVALRVAARAASAPGRTGSPRGSPAGTPRLP